MAIDFMTLSATREYVASTADSLGSLKGAPCTIKSQTETDTSYIIEFEWTGTSGKTENSQLIISKPKDGIDGKNGKDGEKGVGISKIEKVNTVDNIDTYRITFTNNSTFEYEVKNGKDGAGGEGASNWSEISEKPFETLSTDFSVVDGMLKVVGGTGGNDTFIGTMDEYNTAVSEGKITSGTLVIITTEN